MISDLIVISIMAGLVLLANLKFKSHCVQIRKAGPALESKTQAMKGQEND